MATPVLRKVRLPKEDRRRLLFVEDLFRFEVPAAHPIDWPGGRRFGRRADVVNMALRWAKSTGAEPTPTEEWDPSRLVEQKVALSQEFADGRGSEEIGMLVSRALQHYLRGTDRMPTPDGIGRRIPGTERFFRMPTGEVADIWWEAFRLRKDPRDVLRSRMPPLLEAAVGIAQVDASLVEVSYMADRDFERRFADLEQVAMETGVKPARYVEEAAMRATVQKWGPNGGQ